MIVFADAGSAQSFVPNTTGPPCTGPKSSTGETQVQIRSPLVPQFSPRASGRSGIVSCARARSSSRLVFCVPAASTSAGVVMIFFSWMVPVSSIRSTCTSQRPSAARMTSVTWCSVATVTRPVASASAR